MSSTRFATRRVFLKQGAMVLVGTTAVPSFLARAVYAAENAGSGNKRLVVIFLRGAADGLNMVVPHAEPAYYAMRPSIAIPRQSVIDLDGFFGLHPSLAALKPLWDQKHLAIVPAAGSPDLSRSHFDAQDYMESGTPGRKSTPDGWLNRCLQDSPTEKAANAKNEKAEKKDSPFRAVAMGEQLPRILSGSAPAVAIGNVNQFGVAPNSPFTAPLTNTFEAMYADSVDTVLHGTGQETFDAVRMLRSANRQGYTPAAGAVYPRGPLGNSLRQLAQLMKSNLGVEVAFADLQGWDHHTNEGSVQGQMATRLTELGGSLAAFWTDLGDLAEQTTVVTMSEFGRTAHENGNRGTDHGHANVMLVLGGPVRGGRFFGRWPGLAPEQLNQGRDLVLTTDFRTVLSELIVRHLGDTNLQTVFPGFEKTGFLGLLG
jgi:uncharacterized protein (DUF1501 family)